VTVTAAAARAIYRQQIPRLKLFEYLASDVYIPDAKLCGSTRISTIGAGRVTRRVAVHDPRHDADQ